VHPPRLVIALTAIAALALGGVLVLRDGGPARPPAPPNLSPGAGRPTADPLAWTPASSADDVARATAGLAHPLYAKSPGGLAVAVRRTERWRSAIDRAAKGSGVDAATLEAIVLLESGGRPDAQASSDLAGAVGLTQILAGTAQDLLGMTVDLAASRRITRQMTRAARHGQGRRVALLRARRARVDQRFDPQRSLAATVRYLQFAKEQLRRDDLAVASYHMGVGNVQTALRRYGKGTVPYVQLFFDATPTHHARAWRFLSSLGNDSSTYLWRIDAARAILRLAHTDPHELAHRTAHMTARNSAEVALHPEDATRHFDDPDAVQAAYDDGTLVALPAAYLAGHGIRIDARMGELAHDVDATPALYRGLRREALAGLAYVGAGVKAISGATRPLRLASTVRDDDYQAKLQAVDVQAAQSYSLHTTGYTFDIARDCQDTAQARALQFMLDRLTALNLIAWAREPGAIHVTVSSDGARLMEPMGILPKDAAHRGR
jgi:soluble lytic murein transglycosylase-like protein